MINLPKNRLWALPAKEESLKTAEKYRYSYAEPDHVLVVSPDAPEGAKEITEEYMPLLSGADWEWIMLTSRQIANDQAAEFQEELKRQQDEFLKKFEEKLKELREEGAADGERETED